MTPRPHRASALLTLLGLAFTFPACGDSDENLQASRTTLAQRLVAASDEPIATVDGRPIDADAFAATVRRRDGSRTRQQLLDDAIVAELLWKQALEAGYGDSPAIKQAYKRLMVQKLLEDEIERRHRPEDVPAKEVRDLYDQNRYHFNVPALRTSDHLLVMPDPNAPPAEQDTLLAEAGRFSANIHADLDARGLTHDVTAVELEQVAKDWRGKLTPKLSIVVEDDIRAPLRGRGAPGAPDYLPSLDEAYADALFVAELGIPSPPVRSSFGYHIIALRKIEPPINVSFAEAEPDLRETLATEQRRVAMLSLIEGLMHAADARVDPDAPERLEARRDPPEQPEQP